MAMLGKIFKPLRLGPLRVTSALYKAGLLKGGKAGVIKHALEIIQRKGHLYVGKASKPILNFFIDVVDYQRVLYFILLFKQR